MSTVAGARAALTPREAAKELDVSLSSFRRHVLPSLRVVRIGQRMVRIPTTEIAAYVEKQAKRS